MILPSQLSHLDTTGISSVVARRVPELVRRIAELPDRPILWAIALPAVSPSQLAASLALRAESPTLLRPVEL